MAYEALIRIIQEIKTVENSGALSATVILVYVGIDTMAYLSMPADKTKNGNGDFSNWVEKYMNTEANQPYQYNVMSQIN